LHASPPAITIGGAQLIFSVLTAAAGRLRRIGSTPGQGGVQRGLADGFVADIMDMVQSFP